MYVWLIEDEKYGVQGVYRTKRAAVRALANDKDYRLAPSGRPPGLVKLKVQE